MELTNMEAPERETATILKLPNSLMSKLFGHAAIMNSTHHKIVQELLEKADLVEVPTDIPELSYLSKQTRVPTRATKKNMITHHSQPSWRHCDLRNSERIEGDGYAA